MRKTEIQETTKIRDLSEEEMDMVIGGIVPVVIGIGLSAGFLFGCSTMKCTTTTTRTQSGTVVTTHCEA